MPPAAATAARSAQSQAVAAEDQLPPTAAPDDDAPPAQAAPLPLGGDEFPDQVQRNTTQHNSPPPSPLPRRARLRDKKGNVADLPATWLLRPHPIQL
eukprot:COSAG06_NODE_2872_length_6143_cov_2.234088_5_plen_97_part_00